MSFPTQFLQPEKPPVLVPYPPITVTEPPSPDPLTGIKVAHGIMELLSSNAVVDDTSPFWVNGALSGIRVRTDWTTLYGNNWTYLDNILALATDFDMQVGIGVVAGVATPVEIVADYGRITLTAPDHGTMPVPWDPAVLSAWLTFIAAFGARYNAHPQLRYVSMGGMGQVMETYLATAAADVAAVTALGGLPAWQVACETIVDAHAAAFPNTPCVITAAHPEPGQTAWTALQAVVDYACQTYPGQMGVMNAGLKATSDTGYYPHAAVYNYSATNPTGLQFLVPAQNPLNGGTLATTLSRGVALKAHYIEVYPGDAESVANAALLTETANLLVA